MPDYPGVYVEEASTRSREIAGVPTAAAAFVGFAPSGPTDPIVVSGIAEYEAAFGTTSAAQPVSSAVADFFRNGGTKAVIVRVASGTSRSKTTELLGNPKKQTGLHALNGVDKPVGLLLVPDAAYLPEQDAIEVMNAAAAFSEAHDVFHIADVPKPVAEKGAAAAVQWSAGIARSRNLAIYYPWLVAAGVGKKKAKRVMPPSGVAAGIYARLDRACGVWKAPAGQDAAAIGVTGLAANATSAETQSLQSAGINSIRALPGGEVVLWGARTFAGDAEWKYVNLRRLFLFVERSIEEGLPWAVFEPNSEDLWAQVRLEIGSFLYTAWRAGAFPGIKPDEAYFVKCDRTTMTQNDIDNGRLIAMIGIAPIKPAEFVIFRIGLTTAKSS